MAKRIMIVVFIVLLLFLVLRILNNPHQDDFNSGNVFSYSKGNAPDEIRNDVLVNLREFQKGYIGRDIAHVDSFSEKLFSRDILVLGTMPGEVNAGMEKASQLVKDDWQSWGDCRFDMNGAYISATSGTAWFATVGYVRFDLSKYLVLPLRLSGVLVNESGSWKINYLQFQFDLDLSMLLLVLFILIIGLVLNSIALLVAIFKSLPKKKVMQDTTKIK